MRQFVSITVPLIRGALSFVVVISIINAFQAFDQVYVLTGGHGGPETGTYVLGIMLFQHAFAFLDFGYASALAWVIFAILLGLTALQLRLLATEVAGAVMSYLTKRVIRRSIVRAVALYAALIGVAWCALFPILWALSGSLKNESEVADAEACCRRIRSGPTTARCFPDAVLADVRQHRAVRRMRDGRARCSSAHWPDTRSPVCLSGAATRCSSCTWPR